MPKTKSETHLKEIDKGIDKLNFWFIVNTIFTVLSGLALLVLTILEFFKK